jgi:hypothetical protein
MNDRLTKALLAAIALGLWANAVNPWIRPLVAAADTESQLSGIASTVRGMSVDLFEIKGGTCVNRKIC